MRLALLAAASFFALTVGKAHAALVITSERTDLDPEAGSAAKPEVSTLTVDPDKVRAGNADGNGMIFRGDQQTVYMINQADHQYTIMDAKTVAAMRARMDAMKTQMMARMKAMPDAQRKQMEAHMPPGAMSDAPENVTYEKAGSATIGKWSCTTYHKKINGALDSDLCIAPIEELGVAAADIATLKKMGDFMGGMGGAHAGHSMFDFDSQTKAIGFSGVPVQAISYAEGKPQMKVVVTTVAHTPAAAGTFDVPPGFSKRELPMGPPQGAPGGQ